LTSHALPVTLLPATTGRSGDTHSGFTAFWTIGEGVLIMRKADIAEIITETAGIQKTDSMEMVEQVLDLIKSMLQQGEVVKIAGFGNFVVRNKGERKGRNPRTGEEIAITPRRVVTFRPSQLFKKYVNS
jgi:integration host factor subunit alpha